MDTKYPSTRAEAKILGSTQFFTGLPCKYGHVARRNTASGVCQKCAVIKVRKWREDNPEKRKALAVAHYQKTSDQTKARARKWYAENKEAAQARNKKWSMSHKDKMAFYRMRYRAEGRGCDSDLTFDEMLEIKSTQRVCRYCGSDRSLTYDHIVPLAKGGANSKNNIQRLCLSCNSKKQDKDEDSYLASIG